MNESISKNQLIRYNFDGTASELQNTLLDIEGNKIFEFCEFVPGIFDLWNANGTGKLRVKTRLI